MSRLSKIAEANPWRQNPWFESVAVAQRRARRRLPKSVYGALIAGTDKGLTLDDNLAALQKTLDRKLSPETHALKADNTSVYVG